MLTRFFRRRRYRRHLATIPLRSLDSDERPVALAALWRRVTPTDLLTPLDPHQRAQLTLTVWYPHLPALLENLKEQNTGILEEKDGVLEQRARRGLHTKHTVSLEAYLTDADGIEIDAVLGLQRLKGRLQEHVWALRHYDNLFYQRLSEYLYEDLIALTYCLFPIADQELLID